TFISAGPADETGQTLNFIVSNSNNALFSSQPAIAADGTLSYTSAPDANGSALVTVRLHDSGGTANGGIDTSSAQTFTITVTEVNDSPVPASDLKGAVEDTLLSFPASDLTSNDSPGPANESGQSLTVTEVDAASAHGGSVTLSAGTVLYTPAANFNGSDSFSYKVCDNGTTNGSSDSKCTTGTVTITVTAVNDPPSFTKGPDETVLEDAGAQSVPNWATAISAGPSDESSQTLNFVLTVDNPSF